MLRLLRLAYAFVAAAPLAGATTWIVDVNNGPGTDFTQITAAIAAVSAGDTLLVQPGQYTGFALDKQLSIVGLGTGPTNDVLVLDMTLHDLPAGTTTLIANLFENGSGYGGVVIQNCPGAIVLDDLGTYDLVQVVNCVDVRFRRLGAQWAGMRCTASRVEIADSSVVGASGFQCTCCNYPHTNPGQIGLFVDGGEVHVARSSVLGGHGGDDICADNGGCDGDGGAGGSGIVLDNGARLLVAGDAQEFVQGGSGGTTLCIGGSHGPMGAALIVGAGCEVRLSGEAVIGAVQNLGTITTPAPDDPTMNALGAPTAGMIFTLRVHGPPGATADVILGRRPILVSTPALDEEQMTPVNRVFHLGIIPANGTASLNYPVSPAWQKGFGVVFQGRVTYTDSSVHYTNSVPTIVQ
jgi:hypothetical protein